GSRWTCCQVGIRMHMYDGRSLRVRRDDENDCEAFALKPGKCFVWRQNIDWTLFVHLQVAGGRVMSYGMHQVQLSIALRKINVQRHTSINNSGPAARQTKQM
ncbi:unnamed protein product, partial [Ectocarpus sp. 12 AP-2014]